MRNKTRGRRLLAAALALALCAATAFAAANTNSLLFPATNDSNVNRGSTERGE